MLSVATTVLVMSGGIQVVAIIRLVMLRKRFGHIPHLINQPAVRRWVRVSRATAAACVLAAVLAAVVAGLGGQVHFLAGLGLALLLILTHSIADNSPGHGDGDSGE